MFLVTSDIALRKISEQENNYTVLILISGMIQPLQREVYLKKLNSYDGAFLRQ